MLDLNIKEIRELFKRAKPEEYEDYINILSKDPRKGVQDIVKSKKKKLEEEKERLKKLLFYEEKAYKKGYRLIAGVDEAGRGPIAGPVVAAAVILPIGVTIQGINDSKQLTAVEREELYCEIKRKALYINFDIIDERYIDENNILNASLKAMVNAIKGLKVVPDFVLIDGKGNSIFNFPHECIIKGDCLSMSIAAASIIAKVERDAIMKEYDKIYPEYGFAKHKGYATKEHLERIKQYGLCPIHRRTFKIKLY
ncbi:MAG: ribonuclease HII [Firmicutes bacterium]|nr:ribonuclease HII [Bacillota bacterium]